MVKVFYFIILCRIAEVCVNNKSMLLNTGFQLESFMVNGTRK